LAKAKTLAATLGGPATAVYLKVFEKLQDNEDYLVKESERIKKLLEKKTTLASTKIDELQIKQNSALFSLCLLAESFTKLILSDHDQS